MNQLKGMRKLKWNRYKVHDYYYTNRLLKNNK